MRTPSRLSFAPTSSESFRTHHEAVPPVRGRFPEPIRAMRRIRFHHAIDPASLCGHQSSQRPRQMVSNSGGLAQAFNALLAPDIGQMLIKMPNTHCRTVVRLEPEGFARWASSRPVTCSKRRTISAFSIILISDQPAFRKRKLWSRPTPDEGSRKSAYDALLPES
jgi:hypothetical protein